MRARWWRGIVMWMAVTSACRGLAPAPDSSFRSLRRVSVSDGETLPQGNLHLTANVADVGPTSNGTFLVLTELGETDERMILVYGTPADAVFGQYLKGQRVEIDFEVTGRTALADGRRAIRVSVSGMRSVSSTPQ